MSASCRGPEARLGAGKNLQDEWGGQADAGKLPAKKRQELVQGDRKS